MADRLTSEQRHLCMSHIHGKDTKPEILIRRALWRIGFRYRVNVPTLPGKPDIVFPKYRTVLFINGCFWHGHEGCRKFSIPETNSYFWKEKIERNIRRDRENHDALAAAGWRVITIWECELSTREKRESVLLKLAAEITAPLP